MQKITFNQIVAAGICFICLILLGCVLFFPTKGNIQNQGLIIGALISTFTGSAGYFIGTTAGSSNKDATIKSTTDNLVSALSNSAPIPNPPAPTTAQ